VRILTLHGLLHLAGYDHESDEGEMEREERRLRKGLGLPFGLIERSGGGASRIGLSSNYKNKSRRRIRISAVAAQSKGHLAPPKKRASR
jgi:probable rRNA maturation factor